MATASIKKETLDFLKTLKKNNDRDWFNAHKDKYVKAHENMIAFADGLIGEMNKHDKLETLDGKKSLFRIYRDIRFSKDKTPYSCRFSGGFQRATKKLRGGYYFHIEPGNSFQAGGFWGPEPDDIKRIRQDIDMCYTDWKKLLGDKTLAKTFGGIKGEQLGTAPKGYSKDHPAIKILKYKQFILKQNFTDKEVLAPNFMSQLNDGYKKMRPFLNYMSEVLTTDANGVSII